MCFFLMPRACLQVIRKAIYSLLDLSLTCKMRRLTEYAGISNNTKISRVFMGTKFQRYNARVDDLSHVSVLCFSLKGPPANNQSFWKERVVIPLLVENCFSIGNGNKNIFAPLQMALSLPHINQPRLIWTLCMEAPLRISRLTELCLHEV